MADGGGATSEAPDPLLFAERFIALVSDGDHNSTYKVATAIALLLTAQEAEADELSSRRVAEHVLDLYWRQYPSDGSDPLRQMNRADQTSAIEAVVRGLHAAHPASRSQPPEWSDGYDTAVRRIEQTLLAWPLRLLQLSEDQFVFVVPEPHRRSPAAFGDRFDGVIQLKPGVGACLRRMTPIVRPLLESEWVARVARYNGLDLDETALRRRLFGYTRAAWPSWLRPELERFQDGCFYCVSPMDAGRATTRATHIDHFVPWSATMNDCVENLVLAHERCNLRKSDRTPGSALARAWLGRIEAHRRGLSSVAEGRWPTSARRTLSIARAYYGRFQGAGPVLTWDGAGLTMEDLDPVVTAIDLALARIETTSQS